IVSSLSPTVNFSGAVWGKTVRFGRTFRLQWLTPMTVAATVTWVAKTPTSPHLITDLMDVRRKAPPVQDVRHTGNGEESQVEQPYPAGTDHPLTHHSPVPVLSSTASHAIGTRGVRWWGSPHDRGPGDVPADTGPRPRASRWAG